MLMSAEVSVLIMGNARPAIAPYFVFGLGFIAYSDTLSSRHWISIQLQVHAPTFLSSKPNSVCEP